MEMIGQNVLIIPTDIEAKTEGGIMIPSTAKVLTYGVVKTVGPDVENVTEGDNILLPKGELMEIDYKGINYIIIPEDAIVAIV